MVTVDGNINGNNKENIPHSNSVNNLIKPDDKAYDPKMNNLRSSDIINMNDLENDFKIIKQTIEYSDFVTRLVGLVLIIKDFDFYDKDPKYKKILASELPLHLTYYEEKSEKKSYTQNKFPSWLSKELKEESNIL